MLRTLSWAFITAGLLVLSCTHSRPAEDAGNAFAAQVDDVLHRYKRKTLSPTEKVAGHRFPRIGIVYPPSFEDNTLLVSRFDQLVTGLDAQYSAGRRNALTAIRNLNPRQLFIAYLPGQSVQRSARGAFSRQLYALVEKNDLFLRDVRGRPLYLWHSRKGNHTILVNKYRDEFLFSRLYPRAVAAAVDWVLWDGLHYDSFQLNKAILPRGGYGYSHERGIRADINGDGSEDDPAWACDMWLEANSRIVSLTGELIGNNHILHTNSPFMHMQHSPRAALLNGSMHENCFKGPYGNDRWLSEMTGLWRMEKTGRQPPVNGLLAEHNTEGKWPPAVLAIVRKHFGSREGYQKAKQRRGSLGKLSADARRAIERLLRTDWRFLRYNLTSCLLSDAYFFIDIGGGPLGHQSQVWWFDEYDNAGSGRGYLGFPRDSAYEVFKEKPVYAEHFENSTSVTWRPGRGASLIRDEGRALEGRASLFSGKAAMPGPGKPFCEIDLSAIPLRAGTTYGLTFDFRVVEAAGKDFYVSMHSYARGKRISARSVLWFREKGGVSGTVAGSFTTPGQGKPFLGFYVRNWPNTRDPRGAVIIDTVSVRPLGVWRRDYENGLVLCNPTAQERTVVLEKPYRKIQGRQCPAINDGMMASSIMIPPFDGIILLRCPEG